MTLYRNIYRRSRAMVIGVNFAGATVAGVNVIGAFVAEQLSSSSEQLSQEQLSYIPRRAPCIFVYGLYIQRSLNMYMFDSLVILSYSKC